MQTSTVLLIAVFALLLRLMVATIAAEIRLTRQLKADLKTTFEATLQRHGIQSFEILKDSTYYGNGYHASQVYRILFDSTGHYFLYLHVSDSPPVLKPLTRDRALLAAGNKAGFQA